MIEIRTIALSEADEFLRLVCEVFDLNYDRASSVFRREPYFDIKRKWALFESGRIVSCLTTVPLEFGLGRGVGIAGVATSPEHRGQGYGERLLRAATDGNQLSLLFATDFRLYERLGYKKVDDVISGALPIDGNAKWPPITERNVRERYSSWSSLDPHRLRRDSKRWEYWSFSMKSPLANELNYVVFEGNRVRELSRWCGPLPSDSSVEWVGLQSMTKMLNVPCEQSKYVMSLMGRGIDFVPQMFMTDQF